MMRKVVIRKQVISALGVGLVIFSIGTSPVAQGPQAALQQAMRQQPGRPDAIRQRIHQSWLTAEQIRARLQVSGYPPNPLDGYFGAAAPGYPEGIRFERDVGRAGRINIDLPRALRDPNSRDNIILQPGDAIPIPEYLPSVKVSGAVTSPGSVLYRRGAGLDYYLSAAGGFANNADEGRVSVRFANGEVRTKSKWLFFSSTPKPGPGAEVLVPAEDPGKKTDYVALFGSIAQILASTVAISVVATR
jgi:hypothetical protein